MLYPQNTITQADTGFMTRRRFSARSLFRETCERCGLPRPKSEKICPHCDQLSDREVDRLKTRDAREHETNAHIGVMFLALAASLALLMSVVFW